MIIKKARVELWNSYLVAMCCRFNRSDGGYLNDDRVRKHFGHQDDPWNDFYGVAPKERQEFSEVEKNFYLEHEAIRNMKEVTWNIYLNCMTVCTEM